MSRGLRMTRWLCSALFPLQQFLCIVRLSLPKSGCSSLMQCPAICGKVIGRGDELYPKTSNFFSKPRNFFIPCLFKPLNNDLNQLFSLLFLGTKEEHLQAFSYTGDMYKGFSLHHMIGRIGKVVRSC